MSYRDLKKVTRNALIKVLSKYMSSLMDVEIKDPFSTEFNPYSLLVFLNMVNLEFEEKELNYIKRAALEELCYFYNTMHNKLLDNYLKRVSKRLNALRGALEEAGYHVKTLYAYTYSRTIIGAGEKKGAYGLFEVGLCFDPLFGIPYIPASAIKGSCRSFTETNKNYLSQKIPHSIISRFGGIDNLVNEIFGSQTPPKAGRVIFLDSYPVEVPEYQKAIVGSKGWLLEPEVIAPTYKYDEKDPKIEEYLQPTIIVYPVIARGVEFAFTIASRDKDLVEAAYIILWEALEKQGIGAKTAVGYSYFKPYEKR